MSQDIIIPIQTFTCKYVEIEDRLLLTLNYKDINKRVDFWITRAFLLKLLPYFFEYSSLDVKSPVAENENKEQNTSQANPTDNSTFVLTQKEPLLLDSIDFKNDGQNTEIVFKNTEKKVGCWSVLDKESFSNVVNLITNAAPTYTWGIQNIM